MSSHFRWTSSLAALGAAVLLAACGGTEQDPTSAPETATPGSLEASAMETCPEEGYCLVRTNSVRCEDGFNMYAFRTTSGWCISQMACSRHGGPIICGH